VAACTVCELHAESTFKIEGMDCREEVALIERRFKNLPGLEDFSADLIGQRLHVKYDAAKLSASAIAGAVADAGMRAWLEHEEPLAANDAAARRRLLLVWTSGLALVVGLAVDFAAARSVMSVAIAGWLARSFFAIGIAAGASLTARKAWTAVRMRMLDINVLMLVAATGAVALGQWAEAGSVVFLFALAQTLEARTLERARNAVRALLDLAPTEALVRDGAGDRRIDVESVTPGMILVVRPGEKIPLDGIVVSGESAVNQAPVTGESMPQEKMPGDVVFAGTINGRGALDVNVTHRRRDSTLARVIHLVERAQAQRAPAQAFVERFARVYTPSVLTLAALLAVLPPLAFGAPWQTWIYRALVLLVVSCPCALVISTPVSVVAALAGAARKGVLIKGGVHLERAGRVRCVAFDKTGTLTHGTPEVVDVTPLADASPAMIVALAASVEHRSHHPIARAIVDYAASSNIAVAPGDEVQSIDGRGAQGQVKGAHVVLGNHRLFEERQLCTPAVHDRLDQVTARGRTPVLVASGGKAIGIIEVADRPREGGKDALQMLRRQGVVHIVMLTGDNRSTAARIAEELGVDEVRADLLPADKVKAVDDLRERFGSVAMVGDGVNDAPALASADVGIAMGAAGSGTALETADVALMADELLKIPYALRLSRATLRNIQANLAISIVLKAAFIALASVGMATLWMAIVADTGASIVVIANALRLLRAD
jgi:Cd2+/Zn2+-exporting ATPase